MYIAVSRHHMPFQADPRKRSVHLIQNPANEFETYLNSLSEQDACLAEFWDDYSSYAGRNTHLFAFGDHSWPLAIDGTFYDERMRLQLFRTPLLYVAPLDGDEDNRVSGVNLDMIGSQSDIRGTALELLGFSTGGNSIAGLLQGREMSGHEACEVTVQPYGGAVVSVIRNNDKYSYLLDSQTVLHWTIVDQVRELGPSVVREGISYKEFQSLYGCRRYRPGLKNGPSRVGAE